MYKAIQNKKYYLALHRFRYSAKTLSPVYKSGIRIFQTDDMHYYSIVVLNYRIMFGIKKVMCGSCNE